MSDRDDVLARVRAALAGVDGSGEVPPTPRIAARVDLVDHFAARVEDYRAVVERCSPSGLDAAIAAALPPGARVVVPRGLSFDVVGATVDDGTLTAGELDQIDVVVTEAAVGVAETGTIVLDHGPGQGRRVISLVPDRHVCVVRADQIVPDVPDALERLDPLRPQTWISGPSATSDIELSRVEGVHGPRNLHVLIVDG